MIGIIGAMQIEVDALCEKMTDKKKETLSGIDFYVGKLCKKDVVIAKCGIGKVFAAICAQTMIIRFNADIIINTGVAGSLDKRLGIKDIAVSTACVEHDMDTSPLGDPIGLISGINIVEIPTDKELCQMVLDAAAELGVGALAGVIATGDQFIGNAEKKRQISESFSAIACEMEGGAVAHVAYVNSVRCVIIRSISDNADGSAEIDYPEFTRAAAAVSAAVTTSLVDRL